MGGSAQAAGRGRATLRASGRRKRPARAGRVIPVSGERREECSGEEANGAEPEPWRPGVPCFAGWFGGSVREKREDRAGSGRRGGRRRLATPERRPAPRSGLAVSFSLLFTPGRPKHVNFAASPSASWRRPPGAALLAPPSGSLRSFQSTLLGSRPPVTQRIPRDATDTDLKTSFSFCVSFPPAFPSTSNSFVLSFLTFSL